MSAPVPVLPDMEGKKNFLWRSVLGNTDLELDGDQYLVADFMYKTSKIFGNICTNSRLISLGMRKLWKRFNRDKVKRIMAQLKALGVLYEYDKKGRKIWYLVVPKWVDGGKKYIRGLDVAELQEPKDTTTQESVGTVRSNVQCLEQVKTPTEKQVQPRQTPTAPRANKQSPPPQKAPDKNTTKHDSAPPKAVGGQVLAHEATGEHLDGWLDVAEEIGQDLEQLGGTHLDAWHIVVEKFPASVAKKKHRKAVIEKEGGCSTPLAYLLGCTFEYKKWKEEGGELELKEKPKKKGSGGKGGFGDENIRANPMTKKPVAPVIESFSYTEEEKTDEAYVRRTASVLKHKKGASFLSAGDFRVEIKSFGEQEPIKLEKFPDCWQVFLEDQGITNDDLKTLHTDAKILSKAIGHYPEKKNFGLKPHHLTALRNFNSPKERLRLLVSWLDRKTGYWHG